MSRIRSLTAHLVISHVLVATLSMAAIFGVLSVVSNVLSNQQFNRDVAVQPAVEWRFGQPDRGSNPVVKGIEIIGFGLVISSDSEVLFSQGDTPCRTGMLLGDCAPDLIDLPLEVRNMNVGGIDYLQSIFALPDDARVISRRIPYNAEPRLRLEGLIDVTGYVPVALIFSVAGMLVALPVSLIIAWLWVRLQTRRIRKVAQASRAFASGDFQARVGELRHDMIGRLGQQFDSMADALATNIDGLRHLAQRNAELAREAKQAAADMERARVSRDLHDSIAQQLFNASVGATALPDLIDRQPDESVHQALNMAHMLETALLRLRRVLVDLRPDNAS